MKEMSEAARALAAENMLLVPFAIRKYMGYTGMIDDDMMSDGYVGLCKAAAGFNPDAGNQFCTYAIKGILSEIRTRHKLSHLESRQPPQPMTSLNILAKNEDGEISELAELIEDRKADTERDALDHIFVRRVVRLLPLMSAIDIFGYRVTEVADRMGCPKQRVSYLRKKELREAERTLLGRHILDPETVALQKEGS